VPNLDSCIAGVFTPGNIGASSGLPPVEPAYISRPGVVIAETATAAAVVRAGLAWTASVVEAATASDVVTVGSVLTGTMVETASASDVVSRGAIVADVVEMAAADSAQDVAVALKSATLPDATVNYDVSRQANVNGIMVNL
jgi:hypothetical protein